MVDLFFKRCFETVPESLFESIVRVVSKCEEDRKKGLKIKRERLAYLFKIYNEYLAGTKEEDIDCPGCRVRVFGKMLRFKNEILNRELVKVD